MKLKSTKQRLAILEEKIQYLFDEVVKLSPEGWIPRNKMKNSNENSDLKNEMKKSYLDEEDSRKRAGQLRELLNATKEVDNQIIELTKMINIIRIVRTDRIELNFDRGYWDLTLQKQREELLAALERLSIEHPDYKNKLEVIRELCLGIRAIDEKNFQASEEQMSEWKKDCKNYIDKSEGSFA